MDPLATVLGRSRTAGRLLALLSSMPGQELHTRELVRRVSGSEQPVHDALERLERDGILKSRRLGNLRLWRMEQTNPLYGPIRELTAKTVGVAARIAQALLDQSDVELAFVFGSYATGQDDASSDIDLFVLGAPDWRRLNAIIRQLGRELGRELNAVSWTREDLGRATASESPFLESLRRDPKVWILGDQDEFERIIGRVGGSTSERSAAEAARSGRSKEEARARATKPRTSKKTDRRGRP